MMDCAELSVSFASTDDADTLIKATVETRSDGPVVRIECDGQHVRITTKDFGRIGRLISAHRVSEAAMQEALRDLPVIRLHGEAA